MDDNLTIKQLFIQGCANHGSLTQIDALSMLSPMWRKSKNDDPTNSDMETLIEEINVDLGRFDQRIKIVKHELIGENFIVFANSNESEINKFQHHHPETERNLFRMLLKEIVLSEECNIRWIVATNINTSPGQAQIPKNRIQELIESWIQLGYLLEHDSLIYLGPKTMVEFGNYLKTSYPNHIKECTLCKSSVYLGIACQECDQRYHNACIRKYLIKMSKCPECSETWNTPLDAGSVRG